MRNVSQGAVVRIKGTFRDATGALADPTVVTFRVESADGSINDTYVYGIGVNIVRDSVGAYHFDQDTSDQSGVYNWSIIGTGIAVGTQQGEFYVTPMSPDDESSSCEDDSV
jgi:hypothetical protein